MNIKTERLKIRNLNQNDINDVYEIYKDSETCRYLLHDAWSEETKEQHFKNMITKNDLASDRAMNLAVTLNCKVIGILHVWYTEMKETVEIGYSFAKEFGGRGYATESLNGMLEYLFNNYELHRIQAVCDARNEDSVKLCKKVGMRKEAHFIKDYWNKGEWTSSIVLAILKEERLGKNANQIAVRCNPDYLSVPLGPYSHFTEVPIPKQLLVTSGQVGADKFGQIPTDLNKQIENCIINIKLILKNENIDPDKVVKANIYATEKLNWDYFKSEWDSIFNGNFPSMTFTYVSGLAMPELKIEIELWCGV